MDSSYIDDGTVDLSGWEFTPQAFDGARTPNARLPRGWRHVPGAIVWEARARFACSPLNLLGEAVDAKQGHYMILRVFDRWGGHAHLAFNAGLLLTSERKMLEALTKLGAVVHDRDLTLRVLDEWEPRERLKWCADGSITAGRKVLCQRPTLVLG